MCSLRGCDRESLTTLANSASDILIIRAGAARTLMRTHRKASLANELQGQRSSAKGAKPTTATAIGKAQSEIATL